MGLFLQGNMFSPGHRTSSLFCKQMFYKSTDLGMASPLGTRECQGIATLMPGRCHIRGNPILYVTMLYRAYDELHAMEVAVDGLEADAITEPGQGLGLFSLAYKAISTHGLLVRCLSNIITCCSCVWWHIAFVNWCAIMKIGVDAALGTCCCTFWVKMCLVHAWGTVVLTKI
eukprot:scaffold177961_cov16-Tisochrysis_lutea.AAC.1